MSVKVALSAQEERAGDVVIDLGAVRRRHYGRYLEDFVPGQVFPHPRGFLFDQGGMLAFARAFMQTNPLYLNQDYALAHGFRGLPASPQMVFNVVLSLGVQNDSEKAIANLGYYDVQFLRPVYHGETVRAYTQVVDRRERGADQPGIVTIRTIGVKQDGAVVLRYTRKIMVGPRGERPDTVMVQSATAGDDGAFPWDDDARAEIPAAQDRKALMPHRALTGTDTYFEDFRTGDILVHANGRTITDEHLAWTYQTGNTHPLHFDRVYSSGLSGKMSGEPIVYGGLVFAWLEGLASRDTTENAIWELGFTEGYHTEPAFSGDTVAAMSRVLASEPLDDNLGIVTFQLIGVKNISASGALETHGVDLFIKENAKKTLGKPKIPAKIFEIERRMVIKRRRS